MKKIIIIVVAVVLVLGAAAAVFLLMPREIKYYYYSVGEPFVTNIIDSEYLVKAPITLEMTEDLTEDLTEKNAVVRDRILNVLMNTTEDVYRSGNLQQVSDAIVREMNMIFPQEDPEKPAIFTKAYFSDFVMN